MYIKHLALTNFRNFVDVEEITFPEQSFLVAAAPNATGKTNFLEAIAMLLRGKSFRASAEECVRWGEDSYLLRGEVVSQAGEARLAVQYHQPTRKMRIEENGAPASPVTFFSHYPYILFLPDDTNLVIGGPALRRNFLNHILVSLPSYLPALVQYHRALKQRNALLKQGGATHELDAWTDVLIEHSGPLWNQRESFTQFINAQLSEIYQSLTGEELPFKAVLVTSASPEEYRSKLQESLAYEQRVGFTLHGPHRDDVAITTQGRPLRAALSRGQLRSVVIALKIAAYRFIYKTTKEQPLLLLDEVLSELDDKRQATLLKNLPATQILLTCTNVPDILHERGNVHLLDLRSILVEKEAMSPTLKVEQPQVEDAAVEEVATVPEAQAISNTNVT